MNRVFRRLTRSLLFVSVVAFALSGCDGDDGAAGAARGAGIGLGYYTEETAFEGLEILETITPDEDQEAYEALYQKWKVQLESKLKHHS